MKKFNLEDKVRIIKTGLIGEVVGFAEFKCCDPEYCVEYVNFERNQNKVVLGSSNTHSKLKEKSDEHAIKVFSENVRRVLDAAKNIVKTK